MPNKRPSCPQCQRPIKTCLCDLLVTTNNQIPVLVLQHPQESGHAKGSLPLLALSLTHCEVYQGETFPDLARILQQEDYDNILLYPPQSEQPSHTQAVPTDTEKTRLVLLDATWRKSYKMLQLNPLLQALPRYSPRFEQQPAYTARKAGKDHYYSSLEACCQALAQLENQAPRYQALLDNFQSYNQRLLDQRQLPGHPV